MSDTKNTKKRPTHIIWMVTGDGTGFWTRIGAGWQKPDSDKISLRLDCVPLADCRIVLKGVAADERTEDSRPEDAVEGQPTATVPAAEGKRKGGQK